MSKNSFPYLNTIYVISGCPFYAETNYINYIKCLTTPWTDSSK